MESTYLESEISLEILSDFSYKSLERQFPNEQFGRLLILSDLTEGDCSRSVSVRLSEQF